MLYDPLVLKTKTEKKKTASICKNKNGDEFSSGGKKTSGCSFPSASDREHTHKYRPASPERYQCRFRSRRTSPTSNLVETIRIHSLEHSLAIVMFKLTLLLVAAMALIATATAQFIYTYPQVATYPSIYTYPAYNYPLAYPPAYTTLLRR